MINRLYETLNKKGSKYVNTLLNEDVIITEKLDTFRLIFEKKGDQFLFYKKDNTPITLVERVLSDIYESALIEIPIITKEVMIPEGYFFGLYYSPSERPLRIPYSRLPKYILTDVTKRDINNKIIESYDYTTVKAWAASLCMGRPPILFEGKLSEEQKKLLIAYDTKQYKGESMTFSDMIKIAFNTSYSQENIIEGIIIKSGEKITQIISYEFELLNEAYEKTNESRDFYDLIITDVNQFMENYNISIVEAETKDQMYINIVSNIFNNYCLYHDNLSIDEKYLTPPQFGYYGKLNKRLIKNKETLRLINSAPIYEALFKVFISSFRKIKKPYGLLTESIITKFNSYVNLINSYINKFEEDKESEDYVNDYIATMDKKYGNINEARSENIVVDAFKKRNPTDIDNMRVIASIQKTFEPRIRDVARGSKPCAVYITTFEPFTVSQMTNVMRIHDMWKCPIILCAVSNEHKIEGKDFHPSDDLMKAQMQALINENNALIPGSALLVSWSIHEIFEYCRPEFEPIVIITDAGKKSEMTLQLFFEEEVMGGRLSVEDKFNVGELENEDRLTSFRAIEDTNFSLFSELVPHPILNLWNNILGEYRLWSGQILKPIKE